MKKVYVFNEIGASYPSGVFSSEEKAESWIKENELDGTLTVYDIDEGMSHEDREKAGILPDHTHFEKE